jgi:hypothetical protein
MNIRYYTFIEVIIAVAIMALSLVAILGVCSNSSARMAKSVRAWNNAHRTVQAAEYFLLAHGAQGSIPSEFFPYKDSLASFRIEEASSLPEGVETYHGQWKLAVCVITVSSLSGGASESLRVEQIVKEDDK